MLRRSTRVIIEVWLCEIARRYAMHHTQSASVGARLSTTNGELPVSATELETHFFRVECGAFFEHRLGISGRIRIGRPMAVVRFRGGERKLLQ
jgi:hypothetical protein